MPFQVSLHSSDSGILTRSKRVGGLNRAIGNYAHPPHDCNNAISAASLSVPSVESLCNNSGGSSGWHPGRLTVDFVACVCGDIPAFRTADHIFASRIVRIPKLSGGDGG